MQALRKAPETLEELLAEYQALKGQVQGLEGRLAVIRGILAAAASTSPNNSLKVGTYTVSITEHQHERFQLAKAKRTLHPDLMKHFLRVSHYRRLHIKETL